MGNAIVVACEKILNRALKLCQAPAIAGDTLEHGYLGSCLKSASDPVMIGRASGKCIEW
jgi:hypothetical protein